MLFEYDQFTRISGELYSDGQFFSTKKMNFISVSLVWLAEFSIYERVFQCLSQVIPVSSAQHN